jgi:hypothetical protein
MATKSKQEKRPEPFDDLHTAEDEQAVPGHFADVISGPHEGRYGVILDATGKDEVILRTRDAAGEHLTVAYSDLRPASSGRR